MNTPQTDAVKGKLFVEISPEHYHRMLKYASEASPLYSRLMNSIKKDDTIIVPCDPADAEMLLGVARHFCPAAVAKILSVMSTSREKLYQQR
jgi:hypothetical protein